MRLNWHINPGRTAADKCANVRRRGTRPYKVSQVNKVAFTRVASDQASRPTLRTAALPVEGRRKENRRDSARRCDCSRLRTTRKREMEKKRKKRVKSTQGKKLYVILQRLGGEANTLSPIPMRRLPCNRANGTAQQQRRFPGVFGGLQSSCARWQSARAR